MRVISVGPAASDASVRRASPNAPPMALSPVCLCLDALQLPAQRGELLVVVRDELAVVARV